MNYFRHQRILSADAWDYARNKQPDSDPTKAREIPTEADIRYLLACAYDDGVQAALARNPQCTIQLGRDEALDLRTYERILEMLKQYGQCQLIGGRQSCLYELISEVLGKLKLKLTIPVGE